MLCQVRSRFFKIFSVSSREREINANFVKENNFIFICYFEMCKMLFLFITKKYRDLIFFVSLNKLNKVFDFDLFDPSQQDIIMDIFYHSQRDIIVDFLMLVNVI